MEEEKRQGTFFEKHKTELLIAGATVIVLGTLIVAKKEDLFNVFFKSKEEKNCRRGAESTIVTQTVDAITNNEEVLLKEVSVKEHLRNLPSGKFPSVEKKSEAIKKNIFLGEHQTLVSEHTRCCAA